MTTELTTEELLEAENAAMKAEIRRLVDAFNDPSSSTQDLMRSLSRIEWFVRPEAERVAEIAGRGKAVVEQLWRERRRDERNNNTGG